MCGFNIITRLKTLLLGGYQFYNYQYCDNLNLKCISFVPHRVDTSPVWLNQRHLERVETVQRLPPKLWRTHNRPCLRPHGCLCSSSCAVTSYDARYAVTWGLSPWLEEVPPAFCLPHCCHLSNPILCILHLLCRHQEDRWHWVSARWFFQWYYDQSQRPASWVPQILWDHAGVRNPADSWWES